AKESICKEADIKEMLLLTEYGIVDYDTETETQAKVQENYKPKQTMKLVESSSKKIVSKQTQQEMIPTRDIKEEL
ncbi:12217_t:CDS:2, partial [Dentiscutata heterogama]